MHRASLNGASQGAAATVTTTNLAELLGAQVPMQQTRRGTRVTSRPPRRLGVQEVGMQPAAPHGPQEVAMQPAAEAPRGDQLPQTISLVATVILGALLKRLAADRRGAAIMAIHPGDPLNEAEVAAEAVAAVCLLNLILCDFLFWHSFTSYTVFQFISFEEFFVKYSTIMLSVNRKTGICHKHV